MKMRHGTEGVKCSTKHRASEVWWEQQPVKTPYLRGATTCYITTLYSVQQASLLFGAGQVLFGAKLSHV